MKKVLRPLAELCVRGIAQCDPRDNPDREFLYIDIGSVSNRSKRIETPSRIRGAQASVRARQIILKDDVLVSTVRPNLNTVAKVPPELDSHICSTGFCVLRCGEELVPGYLFAFVQSRLFVDSLVDLVQGALYPAVTERQVFAQNVPWVPVEEQKAIAIRFEAQLQALIDTRAAVLKQLDEVELLSDKLLLQYF